MLLDFNGLLIFRAGKKKKRICVRPGAAEFVEWLLDHRGFSVGLWSSMMAKNMVPVVEQLLGLDGHTRLACMLFQVLLLLRA